MGPDGRDLPGPVNGFVDVFDADGNFLQRLVSNGPLNSPWAVTQAPDGFGSFANAIFVANFGDGVINAFDPLIGMFLGTLLDSMGNPITNIGLWDLKFRDAGASTPTRSTSRPESPETT